MKIKFMVKGSMKILHLISQPPDFTGSGKFIQQVISHAHRKGHDNYLVAGVQGSYHLPESLIPSDKAVLIRFDNIDLPFPVAGMSDAMPYESSVFQKMTKDELHTYFSVFKEKISQALERFAPDLIHSHHLWIASSLTRKLAPEIPMVTTCHGTCLRQHQFCPDISQKISSSLNGIDRVMSLGQSQQKQICTRFDLAQDKVPIMPGGYDASLFRPGSKPVGSVIHMVYAGKLCRAKGVPWLLKSLNRINDLPFCLHLAGGGSGEEKATCLELAEQLGDKAVYHGTLSHSDLAALMGQSHLFILPSFFEGVPLVLMEALACGCRVICTDLPGVKEILNPPDNELVHFFPLPPLETLDSPFKKDEPELESKLAEVLANVIRQIRENPTLNLERITKRAAPYTWSKIFDRIEQVYFSAVASTNSESKHEIPIETGEE